MATRIARTPAAATLPRRPTARAGPPAERPLALVAVAAAVLASLLLAYGLGATDRWYIAVGVVLALGLVLLGFQRPATFLLLFVLVRPLLDEYSDLTLGVPGANVGGVLAMLLVLLTVALVLRRPSALAWPTASAWALVVLVTAGLAALAMWDFGGTVDLDPVTEVVRLVSVLAMYLLAAHVLSTPDRVRKLVIAAGLSGVVPAVWGLVEFPAVASAVGDSEITRISGPFVGPNGLGVFLAVTSLILVGLPKDWLSPGVRIPALAVQLVAIVPTYSRVGWIVVVLGIALLEYRRHARVVVGMVVVVVAVVMLVPTVNQRILPSGTATPGSAPTYESYDWRVDNWRTLLDMWAQRPLTGYGTTTTIYVNPRRTTDRQLAPDGGFEAHNAVVRILVEGGLALLAAYALWAVVLLRTVRAMVRSRWELQPVARLLGVLWLLFLVVAVATDDPFGATAILFVFFGLTGALEGAFRASRRARERAAREVVPQLMVPARPQVLPPAGR